MPRTTRALFCITLAAVVSALFAVPALAAPAATAATTNVTANMTEMKYTLNKKQARAGTIVFKLVNKGMIAHDFKIAGKKSKNVAPKKTLNFSVVIKKPGKYPYICTLPGHAAAGMKGVFTVTK